MSSTKHQPTNRQAGIRSPEDGAPPEVRNAAIVPDDSQLVYTGDVNGTQRWVAMDQSMVQFRAAKGTLTFHAWKRTHFPAYWSMGASVTADGVNYNAGIIDSHYYMTVPEGTGCELVKTARAPITTTTTSTNGNGASTRSSPNGSPRCAGCSGTRPVGRPGHCGQRMHRL